MFPVIKPIKHIDFIRPFCNVAGKEACVVFCYIEARVTEEFREGDNVSTVKDPLFGKSVAVAVDFGRLYSPTLVVVIESSVSSAFNDLMTVDITEKIYTLQRCALKYYSLC